MPSPLRLRLVGVNDLAEEALMMPDASIRFARGVSEVRTPEHLIDLRTRIRSDHRGALLRIHAAINERFGTMGATDEYVNVFYAASEMALMESVAGKELAAEDRVTLRRLWEALLAAS
jgi:hypothetical protein